VRGGRGSALEKRGKRGSSWGYIHPIQICQRKCSGGDGLTPGKRRRMAAASPRRAASIRSPPIRAGEARARATDVSRGQRGNEVRCAELALQSQ